MPTKATLLRAGWASRRIAGLDGRPTGARVARGDAIWRGLGAGGRGRRERARNHHNPGWRNGLVPVAITPAAAVGAAVSRLPIGVTGATHPPSIQEPWIYTFYLYFYVSNSTFRWRFGVHAHVHVMEDQVADTSSPTGFRTVYRNVHGNTFVPGYNCWSMLTPHGIVARAPAYDPTVHVDGWGSSGTFFQGNNRYPNQY
jgi:hypothetical protein